jgi:hypothetical protein
VNRVNHGDHANLADIGGHHGTLADESFHDACVYLQKNHQIPDVFVLVK